MAAKRAKDTLERTICSNGTYMSRAELVHLRISNGAVVDLSSWTGKRRLTNPDGSYLDETQISKTAMDYAEFLLAAATLAAT
jgi:hypothetical protein